MLKFRQIRYITNIISNNHLIYSKSMILIGSFLRVSFYILSVSIGHTLIKSIYNIAKISMI